MNEPVPPPPLPEQVFFQGVRTYRNLRTLTAIGGSLLVGSPFAYAIYSHLVDLPKQGWPPPLAWIMAGILLLPAGLLGWKCLKGAREEIEINGKGIRYHQYFWYWSQIKSIAPQKVSFAEKYFLKVGLLIPPGRCLMQMDGLLTPVEYASLLARLQPFLAKEFPAIKLESIS